MKGGVAITRIRLALGVEIERIEHGGSGLRFYEHDWLEDELRGTHPRVAMRETETKPD